MNVRQTALPGLLVIEPIVHRDARGFFLETFHAQRYADAGVSAPFVQDNHSCSSRDTLRGLHLQVRRPQGKLIRVVQGEIWDVAVDVREGSPTFGRWVGETLSGDNFHQLWIPPGFAHGFCTLEPDTVVAYKVTNYYSPPHDLGIAWNDPDLAVSWPISADQAVLSDKDLKLPPFASLPNYFE